MRSLATKYIAACTSAAVLLGAALWFASPLSADGAQAVAKNAKASTKNAKASVPKPPAERTLRAERRPTSRRDARRLTTQDRVCWMARTDSASPDV